MDKQRTSIMEPLFGMLSIPVIELIILGLRINPMPTVAWLLIDMTVGFMSFGFALLLFYISGVEIRWRLNWYLIIAAIVWIASKAAKGVVIDFEFISNNPAYLWDRHIKLALLSMIFFTPIIFAASYFFIMVFKLSRLLFRRFSSTSATDR